MKHTLRSAMLVAILGLAACGDDGGSPIDPGGEPPSGIALDVPATITRGTAFTVTITALDDSGLPDETWNGSVGLSASGGTLSPATVQLVNGTATAQITLSGHVGEVTLRAGSRGVQSDPAAAMVLSGAAAARLEIEPASALLTVAGATQSFNVLAFDEQGAPTIAPQVTWTSNDPAALAIDAAGVATARGAVGSAMIVATANGIESAPALVLMAEPAGDVVLLDDERIVSNPVAVDAAAAFEPGWQYRVITRDATLQAGDLVLGTGERPLAGRVVSVADGGNGTAEVTVALLALDELFTDLRVDEQIPLIEAPSGSGAGAVPAGMIPANLSLLDGTYRLGRFSCSYTTSLPSLDLPDSPLDLDASLHLDFSYDNGLNRYAVIGSVTANASYRPVLEVAFEGSTTCETVLRTFTLPSSGFLSLLYGVQVPIGIGFTLDGELEVAEVGFDISADATADVALGLECAASGTCTGVQTFDVSRDWSFELVTPDPSEQFRAKLGGYGFVFAKPYLGSVFTKQGSFEFIDARAGLRQNIDLATPHYQAADPDYASSFSLHFLASIGPGEDLKDAIEQLGKMSGLDLSGSVAPITFDDTLAQSPRGTFTISPAQVAPGDSTSLGDLTTFTVDLDPVTYLGTRSVDEIEFLWRREADDSTFTLDTGRPPCTLIAAGNGDSNFECKVDFLQDHAGLQTFHAFVHARLFGVPLPFPLEIAADARATVDVGGVCPAVPDWAVPSIDKTTTAPGAGGSSLAEAVADAYNSFSVSAEVQADSTIAWATARATVGITDYLYITPLVPVAPSDFDDGVYLRTRSRARSESFASDDYDDTTAHAHAGADLGGGASTDGTTSPGAPVTFDVDELVVQRMYEHQLNNWAFFSSNATAYARTRFGQRSASANAEVWFDVQDAVLADGTVIPLRICSASGHAY